MKTLSIDKQIALMRCAWPQLRTSRRRSGLFSRGWLHPSPLTGRYRVRIELEPVRLPHVYIEAPQLRPRRRSSTVPHTYASDEPCLFWPEGRDWSSSMAICDTVVPWLAEWLVFYELWLVTGEWAGGGKHPESADHARNDYERTR